MEPLAVVEATILVSPRSVQHGLRVGAVGKGSKRKAVTYSDGAKKLYASEIIRESKHLAPEKPLSGGIIFCATFYLPHDGSKSGPAWQQGPDDPDLDNIEKGTIDGLVKAGFMKNDCMIYAHNTVKVWADELGPRIELKLIQTHD